MLFSKKKIYIGIFVFSGILAQAIIHGVFEIWYIGLLLRNFTRYSLGYEWNELFAIHHVLTIIFYIAGVVGGFLGGVAWWKKYGKKERKF